MRQSARQRQHGALVHPWNSNLGLQGRSTQPCGSYHCQSHLHILPYQIIKKVKMWRWGWWWQLPEMKLTRNCLLREGKVKRNVSLWQQIEMSSQESSLGSIPFSCLPLHPALVLERAVGLELLCSSHISALLSTERCVKSRDDSEDTGLLRRKLQHVDECNPPPLGGLSCRRRHSRYRNFLNGPSEKPLWENIYFKIDIQNNRYEIWRNSNWMPLIASKQWHLLDIWSHCIPSGLILDKKHTAF